MDCGYVLDTVYQGFHGKVSSYVSYLQRSIFNENVRPQQIVAFAWHCASQPSGMLYLMWSDILCARSWVCIVCFIVVSLLIQFLAVDPGLNNRSERFSMKTETEMTWFEAMMGEWSCREI